MSPFLPLLLLLPLASSAAPTLAAGHHFTCALGGGGAVYCWGENSSGQLGDGTREPRKTPVRVLGLSGAKELATGAQHACARNDAGEVFCWGHNGIGQSGDPLELFLLAPRKVGGLPPAARIFAGEFSTCAATTDGKLFCWGRNANAQLATPRVERENGRPTPLEIKGLRDVRGAAFSEGHVCALTGEGEVFCWGDNDHGRAGGKGKLIVTPTRVAGVEKAVAIATTGLATFVLAGGKLVWWGSRHGDRDWESASSPKAAGAADALFTSRFAAYVRRGADGWSFPKSGVAPLLPLVELSWATELVAGDNHACGRAKDGQVRCWGWNRELGVGDGSTSAQKVPVPVRLDAAERKPPRPRLPERASCEKKADAVSAPAARPATCGNGKRDVISVQPGVCAPCIPGRKCPCSPPREILEACDGADLGGETCASRGLRDGELRCTASCVFDDSQCRPPMSLPSGAVVAWPAIPAAKKPGRALDLAAKAGELGAAWSTAEGCGNAVFARFSSDLKQISTSEPFGRAVVSHIRVAAMPRGWLVALGARSGRSGVTSVHVVGDDGKPGPERAALAGLPVFLQSAGPEGPWLLGLSTREHEYLGALSVVVLDARGAVVAEREVYGPSSYAGEILEGIPRPVDQVAATASAEGILVARSQMVPGMEGGGVVVARLSSAGRVEAASLVVRGGAAPFWWNDGEGTRLGWLRNEAPPGSPARFVVESSAVDAAGVLRGEVHTLAELDEGEWFTSGTASPKGPALLVPRLDLSGSTIQSGLGVRLTLIEPPLRSTLIEGKGVVASRLVGFGDFLVAGFVWRGGGPEGLALVKLLPAAMR